MYKNRNASENPTLSLLPIASARPTVHKQSPSNPFPFFVPRSIPFCSTGSVSSEEGEDWPSSPVVPVYEQC